MPTTWCDVSVSVAVDCDCCSVHCPYLAGSDCDLFGEVLEYEEGKRRKRLRLQRCADCLKSTQKIADTGDPAGHG